MEERRQSLVLRRFSTIWRCRLNRRLRAIFSLFLISVSAFLICIHPAESVELPLTITYQGRLYDSSSNPIENTVDLQLDIYSQDGSCLLYSESKQLNLSSSNGFFSTQIGSVTGSNSRTSGVDPGLSMQAVFDNSAAKTGASSCAYTPSARDGRKIQVTIVKIGSTTVNTVLSPKQNITSVPYATVAQTLQGKGAESFVQLTGSITQSDFEGLMAKKSELLNLAGQETALLALANGTSTTYLKAGSNISAAGDISLSAGKSLQLGTFSTAQETPLVNGFTSADVGKTWYNSDTNQLMYYDGTSAKAVSVVGGGGGGGGGSISVVAGSAPISVANGSTSPTVSLNYGTGLTVTSSQLVPDFGTASGKVAQGNDSRFNPTLSGAGDAGKIVQVNSGGTGYQFVPANLLSIDSTNSRIGIGTTSPSSLFQMSSSTAALATVNTNSTAYAASIRFMENDNLNTRWEFGRSGTNNGDAGNLYLYHGSNIRAMTITPTGQIGMGASAPSVALDIGSKTDAVRLPSGTTAERPASPVNGDIRYNTSTGSLETYMGGMWQSLAAASGSVDNSSTQSIAGAKTFTYATTFSSTGPAVALDVTGTGGLQTTLLNVTGATTMTGNINVNSGKFFVNATSGKVGVGTTTPTNDLSLSGQTAKTVGMERHPTADTAGNNLIVSSGGATSGATDKNGGKLILSSGTSTGSGASSIEFQTATPGSTGTSDNAPSTKMTITGDGKVGIGTLSPAVSLDMSSRSDAVRLPSGATGARPSSAANGDLRYNTSTNVLESYVNGAWQAIVVAGGVVDNHSTQSIAGAKTFTNAAIFSAAGPSVALDVTGAGGLQTTALNVTGVATLAGDINVNSGKFFVDATNAKVGIGTGTPAAALDVAGGIRAGVDADSCTAAKAGTIQWNGTNFLGCNGTSWVSLGGAGGTSPTNFSFNNLAGVAFNSVNCSNAVTVSGLNVPVYASVPYGATGAPYVKINGSGSSSYGTIQSGNTLQVCATSANTNLGNITVPVTVGNYTTNWDLTTGNAQPNPFSFNNPSSPVSVSMTVDNCATANIQGLTLSSPVTVSVDKGSVTAVNINGSGYVAYTGSHTISNNQSLCVRITTNNNPNDVHNVTVSIGSGVTGVTAQSATYSVSNPAQDTTPNAFDFSSYTLSSNYWESNAVTINGITGSVPVSTNSGEIRVAGGSWATSATIQNGETLQLRVSYGTSTAPVVTVGTVSDTASSSASAGSVAFTSSGTFYFPPGKSSGSVRALVVGGGGAGYNGGRGGGGASGYVRKGTYSVSSSVSVTVGGGGSSNGSGSASSFGGYLSASGGQPGGTTGIHGTGAGTDGGSCGSGGRDWDWGPTGNAGSNGSGGACGSPTGKFDDLSGFFTRASVSAGGAGYANSASTGCDGGAGGGGVNFNGSGGAGGSACSNNAQGYGSGGGGGGGSGASGLVYVEWD